MFTAIHFKNFRVLKDATLPLGRCTLIVGPNGSGKSTALSAIELLRDNNVKALAKSRSATASQSSPVELKYDWSNGEDFSLRLAFEHQPIVENLPAGAGLPDGFKAARPGIRVYRLDARAIANQAPVQGQIDIGPTGAGLVAVLDRLRDRHEDEWNSITLELNKWFPEFDRILFDVVGSSKSFSLRSSADSSTDIRAAELSDGVLLSLAFLTLAHLPEPPKFFAIEEPERGIHPRLLRDVFQALRRMTHPEDYGIRREPVQIVVTTHSPYLLDYFRDFPEDVVMANRIGDNVQFQRLSEFDHFADIVGESSLGDAWYTGVLGGVPAQ